MKGRGLGNELIHNHVYTSRTFKLALKRRWESRTMEAVCVFMWPVLTALWKPRALFCVTGLMRWTLRKFTLGLRNGRLLFFKCTLKLMQLDMKVNWILLICTRFSKFVTQMFLWHVNRRTVWFQTNYPLKCRIRHHMRLEFMKVRVSWSRPLCVRLNLMTQRCSHDCLGTKWGFSL